MRCKFYHIEKYQQYRNNNSETTFKAARIKDKETGKTELYPMKDKDDKEVFIYGQGWKRVNKKSIVDVPHFSWEVEDWNKYIEDYGRRCLFFSLTGEDLKSPDASVWMCRKEFESIDDIEKFTRFMLKLDELQKAQIPILEDYKGKVNFPYNFVEDHIIEPSYDLGGKIGDGSFLDRVANIILIGVHLDPMTDERKMRSVYYKLRMKEINPDTDDLFTTAKEIDEELANDKLWPTSIKDQMLKLYGEKVTALYEELLDLAA